MHESRMRPSWLAKFAAAALFPLTVAVFAACSSSDSDTKTPSPTSPAASATATAAPTLTPATPTTTSTVAPSPTPAAPSTMAQRLATAAGYFLYVVRTGDDLGAITGLFNGEPGSAKAGFAQEILDANSLSMGGLTAGQQIAIPLLNTPGDIIPSAGLAGAFERGAGVKLTVLEPSAALRSAYGDSVALHAVEVANAANAGYRMEYWLTSTPFSATATLNRAAKVITPLMVITAGSMVPAANSTAADTARFDRSGVSYALTALAGAKASAADLAAMLEVAKPKP